MRPEPKAFALRLLGSASTGPTPHDGEFLESMDFEAHGGRGEMVTTPDLAKAMRFDVHNDPLKFLARSPKCAPTRPDGRPNRPLTKMNWEFVRLEQ